MDCLMFARLASEILLIILEMPRNTEILIPRNE